MRLQTIQRHNIIVVLNVLLDFHLTPIHGDWNWYFMYNLRSWKTR